MLRATYFGGMIEEYTKAGILKRIRTLEEEVERLKHG